MQREYMDIYDYPYDIDKYNATNNDTDNYNDIDNDIDELSSFYDESGASVDSDKILCGKRFTIRLCSTFND